jgi:hypothetical protein
MSDAEESFSSSGHCNNFASRKDYSSHEESNSFSGSVTNSNASGLTGKTPAEEAIALKESRQVRFSKMLFLCLLMASATVAGVATWIFTKRSEKNDFETQVSDYHSPSRKIPCLALS